MHGVTQEMIAFQFRFIFLSLGNYQLALRAEKRMNLFWLRGSLYDNDANGVLISPISRCKLTLNATVHLRLRWRQSSISDLEFGQVGSPSQIEDHC